MDQKGVTPGKTPSDRLTRRTVRITTNRPEPPREGLFDPATGLLSWIHPHGGNRYVTHYRLRFDTDAGEPDYEVPVGQTALQLTRGVNVVYLSSWNQINGQESEQIAVTVNFSGIPAGAVAGATGPFLRTIDLKDTTVGDNIADATIVHNATAADAKCLLFAVVLRMAITADLTVRLNIWVAGVKTVVGTFTVPLATAINTTVTFATFSHDVFPDLSVLTWDVTASDGQVDRGGVASCSVWWR